MAIPRITDLGIDEIKTIERLRAPSIIIEKRGSAAVAVDSYGRIIAGPSTDHSSVIRAAINALPQGGKIFFRKGDYNLSTGISVNLYPAPGEANIKTLVLEGEGPWTRIIGPPNTTSPALHIYRTHSDNKNYHRVVIRDMTIAANSSRAGARAIKIDNVPLVSLENVITHWSEVGIELASLTEFIARNVYAVFNVTGIKTTAAPESPTTMWFEGCTFRQNTVGVHLEDALGAVFLGGVIESNSDTGLKVTGVSGRHVLLGVWFENNTNWDIDDQTGVSVYNHKNYMIGVKTEKVRFGANAWWEIVGSQLGSIVKDTKAKVYIRRAEGYDSETFKVTGASVSVGTGNAYNPPTTITSKSGVIAFPRVKITWGGTFISGETVTVKVEAVYTDGSTAYIEKAATSTGSLWLADDDILALVADGKDIAMLNIYAKSSASSTAVTVTADAYGKA